MTMQETRAMAQNDKGGADLDIFEGLGKKAAPSRTSSGTQRSVPPPPPSMRQNESKRTLVGMTAPATLPGGSPSSGGFPPPPSTPSRMPPPPPGRGSLPPMGGGAPKTNAAAPAAQAKSNVDVDWDDDDEATQVFAEDATHVFAEDATKVLEEDKTRALPSGAATPAPMPAAGMPASMASRPKATLLGLTAPAVLPPPNSRPNRPLSTPPPPPAGAFSRPPTFPGPSSYPPPPTINPSAPPPAPMPTQKGLGMPPWGSPAPAQPMPAPAPRSSGADYVPPGRGMEATQMLQPRTGLTPSRVAIAIVAVVALVLGVLVLMPSKGKIVVNVSDSRGATVNRLDVFVDGEKTNCATAPCYLPYGQGTHEVKVVADGYDVPAPQAVVVKSGDPATVNFTLGSTNGSGIKVGGAQAGVKLYVDDKEVGPLPQIVRDLTPGDHTIRVAGSERYQPLERHVTVERDKLEDLGTITLKVLKGKVTVSLGTSGARVFIVSGSDRRELPMLPISVDIDTAKSWSLEGTKAGYDDYRQLISFDDGQAEKTYTVTLEPKSAGSAAAPQTYAPAPAYNPPPTYQAAAPAPRAAPAPQSGGGDTGGGGEAFLNINSIPPSTCILDGKSLGSTPRIHVSVKPGSHTVKFVDSDDGLTKTIFVNVGSGETKPAVAKLN
jgi:serine/threonine-protein kinase